MHGTYINDFLSFLVEIALIELHLSLYLTASKPGNLAVYNIQTDTSHNLEKYKNDPKYACTYMEISHRDFEQENNSACRGSLSSSISKDSLVSHDSRKGSLEISSDHGKKQSSSERELSVEKTEPVNKVADAGGTTFTVEIGEQKPRKWNSLSEFMPSKIRRSFRERSERAMKQSTKDGTAPKFVVSIRRKRIPFFFFGGRYNVTF